MNRRLVARMMAKHQSKLSGHSSFPTFVDLHRSGCGRGVRSDPRTVPRTSLEGERRSILPFVRCSEGRRLMKLETPREIPQGGRPLMPLLLDDIVVCSTVEVVLRKSSSPRTSMSRANETQEQGLAPQGEGCKTTAPQRTFGKTRSRMFCTCCKEGGEQGDPSMPLLFNLGSTDRWWQCKLHSLKVNDCLPWTTFTSFVRRPGSGRCI